VSLVVVISNEIPTHEARLLHDLHGSEAGNWESVVVYVTLSSGSRIETVQTCTFHVKMVPGVKCETDPLFLAARASLLNSSFLISQMQHNQAAMHVRYHHCTYKCRDMAETAQSSLLTALMESLQAGSHLIPSWPCGASAAPANNRKAGRYVRLT